MKDVADSKLGKYSSLSLEELVKLKQDALQKEDYDVAKEIKEEIEKRKNGN
jgi:predicted nucleotidyltransferase